MRHGLLFKPTQACVNEGVLWQHTNEGPIIPVSGGAPLGYEVGLQPYILSKLIHTYECLKSCAACESIPIYKRGSLRMASTCCLYMGDTACEMGSAKRARGPSRVGTVLPL